MTDRSSRPPPKPWSMKWIVLAIAAFVVVYTTVNLLYRKPGQPYRPYQDAQDRATTARLLAAGWQKVPLDTRRPVEKPALADSPAPFSRAAPGLGQDLEAKFAEKPKLLASIDRVTAPAAVSHGGDYTAYFTATITDQKLQLGEITLYRKGNELVIIPEQESLPGKNLLSRWPDSNYWIAFSTAKLPEGRYDVRIVAKGPAAAWSFTVR
jgi:hypothetical protein